MTLKTGSEAPISVTVVDRAKRMKFEDHSSLNKGYIGKQVQEGHPLTFDLKNMKWTFISVTVARANNFALKILR